MDICNPSENSVLARFFCIAETDFLIYPIIGRFYKMRVLRILTFTTLSPFINTVLSFSNTM